MGAAEFSGMTPEFCEEHGLRYKAMLEIRRLRRQLTNVINFALEENNLEPITTLDSKGDSAADSKPISTLDSKGDSAANSKRITNLDAKTDSAADSKPFAILDAKMDPPTEIQARLLRQIVVAGLASHVAKRSEAENAPKGAYESLLMKDPIFIHPSSVLAKLQPEFVIYQEIVETNKKYMQTVMAVEPEWLPRYAGAYCEIGQPLDEPPPYYCRN